MASRNRGGSYFRKRTIPTNPNTLLQQTQRESLGSLANNWGSVLTEEQRAGWIVYASNVTVTNALGNAIHLTGMQQYIRSNVPRLQASLAVVADAPTIFNIGETPIISAFTMDTVDGLSLVASVPAGTLVTDQALAFFGRPQGAGIGYFRGPYRLFQKQALTTGGAIIFTQPLLSVLPFAYVEGQKCFVRMTVSLTDGRYSAESQGMTVVATA